MDFKNELKQVSSFLGFTYCSVARLGGFPQIKRVVAVNLQLGLVESFLHLFQLFFEMLDFFSGQRLATA